VLGLQIFLIFTESRHNAGTKPMRTTAANNLLLQQAWQQATAVVQTLAGQPYFKTLLRSAFGNSFTEQSFQRLALQMRQGRFDLLPRVEILTNGELGNAAGGYAIAQNRIYINGDFLTRNAGNVTAIADVLLEEIGHSFDRRLNGQLDSAGDEGEIFRLLARGVKLSTAQLQAIRAEDDRATVTIRGQLVSIEQIDLTNGNDNYVGTTGNDTVYGLLGNDSLYGGDGNDFLFGDAGSDYLYGQDGNDAIYGDLGNDSLNGGAGNDYLYGSYGNDSVYGGDGNDSLYGDAGIDTVVGASGNDAIYGGSDNDLLGGGSDHDTLYGENGNDRLDGGIGRDTLIGGNGADTMYGGTDASADVYYVDDIGDQVIEVSTVTTAIDSVYSYINYTLTANIERLYLWGGTSGTGNDLNNIILGYDANNYLDGGIGNDTINSGSGRDTLSGGAGNDSLQGESGNDVLRGNNGEDNLYGGNNNDTLYGGDDNDYLNGGNNDDILDGDQGNDNLIGDNGNDSLYGDNGNDTLRGGDGDDTLNGGIGNDYIDAWYGNDHLFGRDGNDTLSGGDGDDSLYGDNGNDTLYGGDGNDSLFGSFDNDSLNGWAGDDSLNGENGNDTLYGDDGNDTLFGGYGDDSLNGGFGVDTMIGGIGNDSYHIGHLIDQVIETSTIVTEIDSVHSYINSYTLTANVENLHVRSGVSGTGNALNNTIVGYGGNNILNGGSGNDTIDGGLGLDSLTGGAGVDRFILHKASGIDTIADFAFNEILQVSATEFGGGLVAGALAADRFVAGAGLTTASNTTQRFIFDTTTRSLYFDIDGSGAAVAEQIAVLQGVATLTAASFAVVS
jgi:Ca2+-binding RTX toxin-like protein